MSAKLQYRLTTVETSKLAYQFAKLNKKSVPQWEKHQIAGQGWLCMFWKHNAELALRKP
jgi:hypothetical protein